MNRRELLIGSVSLAATDRPAHAAGSSGLAARLATDPRRPQYHLLPPANWMNDPNGPIFRNGQYHMFYQYNPHGAYWGDMHWGHAVSPDMVHWRHLPIALAPTPGGPDADGCFTGSAVVHEGLPALFYTGVHGGRETQCLATSRDPDLAVWTKRRDPVIAAPPPGRMPTGFRDPALFFDRVWHLCIGSGERGQGGTVLLYRSPDLRRWEYLHPLPDEHRPDAGSGDMWECPDFFPLDGRHVLLYSTAGKSWWQSGTLDRAAMRFHPARAGVLDHGAFYAAKTQLDAAGRRILWGWIPETRPLEEYRAAGWAGLLSLPRVLSLDGNGDLVMTVAPPVDGLRVKTDTPRIATGAGEYQCRARLAGSGFEVSLAAGNRSLLAVAWDAADPLRIRIDNQPLALRPSIGPELEFGFHVDGSVVELLVDRRIAMTRRFYEPGEAAPVFQIENSGAGNNIVSVSAYEMRPISPDRLTT